MQSAPAIAVGLYIGTSLRWMREFTKALKTQAAKLDELLAEINKYRNHS